MNTKETVQRVVTSVASDFEKIRKVHLFGSVAKGTQTEESDVDLCLCTDNGFSLFDAGDFGNKLRRALGTEVDIVTERSCRPYVADSMRKEKVLVYER